MIYNLSFIYVSIFQKSNQFQAMGIVKGGVPLKSRIHCFSIGKVTFLRFPRIGPNPPLIYAYVGLIYPPKPLARAKVQHFHCDVGKSISSILLKQKVSIRIAFSTLVDF